MMNNNKILTVSYGTFSCTLEGFDDSFGTMKAIAEYFRGLSSDAPYFGAEPPQPDADMLARIAQKEISRRVEAREHEGKIHLSAREEPQKAQTDAPRALSSEAPATAAVVTAAVLDVASQEQAVEASVQDATASDAADVEPTMLSATTDELEAIDTDTAQTLDVVEAEDKHAEATPEPVLNVEFEEEENDIVPGQRDADVEAFFATSTDTATIEDEDIDAPADASIAQDVTPTPQNDSIAAKLQRIRAVVARQDEADEEDDYVEDQHADQPEVQPNELMATAQHDIEDAMGEDEAVDLAAEETGNDSDDITAILNRLDAADDAETAVEVDVITPQIAEKAHADEALDNLFGEEAGDDDSVTTQAEGFLDTTPEVSQVEEETPTVEEEPRVPRARVIKVKRADLEAAIKRGDLEEYGDDAEDTPPSLDDLAPSKSAESTLSAEDEAELARELADLEAEVSNVEDLSIDSQPQIDTTTRNVLPTIDGTQDDDMNRLMAETDQQMDEPESATRRDAFAHLRAAVAAKKADVAMGASENGDESDDAYRNDLADVVRPRRPVSAAGRTERPTESRPAPLKLVAEQRIDVESTRPAGPVRPRRVAAVNETAQATPSDDSFADYAAEMGATKLPQLLEAAAAYMSFVEGREQFSRPQLMTKVRQVGPEDGFSREDGLRSFGQLLRAGKIEKIKGGRFTVSEDIGYRPDHRAAG